LLNLDVIRNRIVRLAQRIDLLTRTTSSAPDEDYSSVIGNFGTRKDDSEDDDDDEETEGIKNDPPVRLSS
jgi:hypothetical protein